MSDLCVLTFPDHLVLLDFSRIFIHFWIRNLFIFPLILRQSVGEACTEGRVVGGWVEHVSRRPERFSIGFFH